ncbi:MAG: hypothetical protein HZB82_02550 [Deltaproteobacteria bacterium]|nr:hypothetical protein [Deltaproteobacteria bacterium]
MKKFLLAALMVIASASSAIAYMPTPLKDVTVSANMSFDTVTGIYTYNYEIYNPPVNTNQIRHFEIDISKGQGDADLRSDGLVNGQCYDEDPSNYNLARFQMVPVGMDGPYGFVLPSTSMTIWGCGLGPNGKATWASNAESALLSPGNSLTGPSIKSYGLPGIREGIIIPYIDYDSLPPEYEENIELTDTLRSSLVYKFTTVGPVAPPAVFSAVGFIDRIIALKHKAFLLGWIKNSGLVTSLDAKLDNAKKKLAANDIKTAKNLLAAFISEVEAQNEKGLAPEAYALLKYNAEYLLSRL